MIFLRKFAIVGTNSGNFSLQRMSYKVSIETLFDLKFYVIDAACWGLAVWSSCGGVIIIIVSENRHWLVFLLFFAIYESF